MEDNGQKHQTRPLAFALAKDVAAYLRAEGFKTSVRGVYDHVAKGKLRKHKDGTFLRQDVERYAARHLPRLDGGTGDKHTETLQRDKLQADVQRAIEDARLKRLRADLLDGKLVPAAQYEQALAARAALFKRSLSAWCHHVVDRAIETCNGDPKKAPLLLDVLLAAVREYLNQYAMDQEFVADVEEARAFLEAARAAEVPK